MRKMFVVLGAITAVLLMVSTSVAVPTIKNKPTISKLKNINEIQNVNLAQKGYSILDILITLVSFHIYNIYYRWYVVIGIPVNIKIIIKEKRLTDIGNWFLDKGFTDLGKSIKDFAIERKEKTTYVFSEIFNALLSLRTFHLQKILEILLDLNGTQLPQ